MPDLKTWFTKYGAISFNIYFIIFLLWLRPWLFSNSIQAIYADSKLWLFSIAVILLILVDLVGITMKCKNLRASSGKVKEDIDSAIALGVILWIGRLALSSFVVMVLLESTGNLESIKDGVIIPLMMGFVIKEILVLGYIFDIGKNVFNEEKPPLWKNILANGLLWISISIMYTLTWESSVWNIQPLSEVSKGDLVGELVGAAILFLILYLPLQLPFIMEDQLTIETPKEIFFEKLSFFAVFGFAIYSLF